MLLKGAQIKNPKSEIKNHKSIHGAGNNSTVFIMYIIYFICFLNTHNNRLNPDTLENRLIDFASGIIDLIESLPQSKAYNHISGQLLRSGTSPAPNYAEARGAESAKDFSHKLKIALKELRETNVWLKIILKRSLRNSQVFEKASAECDELISIFVSSTRTADRKRTESLRG